MFHFAEWLLLHEEEKPENHIDALNRELNIDPNTIPEFIETGQIEFPEEGLLYNQAIWRVIKPIDKGDKFVRIQFHKSMSPNLDQVVLKRQHDGSLARYTGPMDNKIHLLPMERFAQIFSLPWQTTLAAGGMGGGMGGMGGMA